MSSLHTQDKSASRDDLPLRFGSSSLNTTMNLIEEPNPTSIKSSDKPTPIDKNDGDNGDGDSSSESKGVVAADKAKRFLPAYKKANAALTFPEKVREQHRGAIGNMVVWLFHYELLSTREISPIR